MDFESFKNKFDHVTGTSLDKDQLSMLKELVGRKLSNIYSPSGVLEAVAPSGKSEPKKQQWDAIFQTILSHAGIAWTGNTRELFKNLNKGKGSSEVAYAVYYWLHTYYQSSDDTSPTYQHYALEIDRALLGQTLDLRLSSSSNVFVKKERYTTTTPEANWKTKEGKNNFQISAIGGPSNLENKQESSDILKTNKSLSEIDKYILLDCFEFSPKLYEIIEEQSSILSDYSEEIDSGYLPKEFFQRTVTNAYYSGILYSSHELLFDRDIRDCINDTSASIKEKISGIGQIINNLDGDITRLPKSLIDNLMDFDLCTEIFSYINDLRDAFFSQVDRLKKLVGSEIYFFKHIVRLKERILEMEEPEFCFLSDRDITQKEWSSIVSFSVSTYNIYGANQAFFDDDLKQDVAGYMNQIDETASSLTSGELVAGLNGYILNVIDTQLDRLRAL